ncbi:MAG: hypothetical protein BroJett021_40550 [Chloroflexota bacterium]|nr:MAG: hypothetical protein BroJett021_40550 [Chloroflexota bacterium]
MAVGFVIKDLIVAAAVGAGEDIEMLRDNKLPVELEEFEIEVTYAAETLIEISQQTNQATKLELKFFAYRQKIGTNVNNRNKATYGMKVRFLFKGGDTDEQEPAA